MNILLAPRWLVLFTCVGILTAASIFLQGSSDRSLTTLVSSLGSCQQGCKSKSFITIRYNISSLDNDPVLTVTTPFHWDSKQGPANDLRWYHMPVQCNHWNGINSQNAPKRDELTVDILMKRKYCFERSCAWRDTDVPWEIQSKGASYPWRQYESLFSLCIDATGSLMNRYIDRNPCIAKPLVASLWDKNCLLLYAPSILYCPNVG